MDRTAALADAPKNTTNGLKCVSFLVFLFVRHNRAGSEAGAKGRDGLHEQRAPGVQHQDAHDPQRASQGPEPEGRELGAVLAAVPQEERQAEKGRHHNSWGAPLLFSSSSFCRNLCSSF